MTMRWSVGALGVSGVLAVVLVAVSAYAWTREGGADSILAERGRLLFETKGCVACHYVERQGGRIGAGGQGPNLSSLPEVAGTRVERMSAEEYVRMSILNPEAYTAPGYGFGFGMPRLDVTGDELDALVAFLLEQG